MKKIITKISLLPLLMLFTKKKTVRSHSDISVTTKLKREKAGKENEEKIKSYKVKRSEKYRGAPIGRMSNMQLLNSARKTEALLNAIPYSRRPLLAVAALNVIITDFHFALLVCNENKTPVTVDKTKKARQDLVDSLAFLKAYYNA